MAEVRRVEVNPAGRGLELGMHGALGPRILGLGRLLKREASVGASFPAVLLVASAVAICVSLTGPLTPAAATSTFGAQTGKECAYCHLTPGGPLTAEGTVFHDAGDRLPEEPTGGTTTTGVATGSTGAGSTGTVPDTSPPGTGSGLSAPPAPLGTLLALPDWLHDLLLWAHLVAMTTWLGAIIFVHVVQTPRIAGQGIPRGYLQLAWPAIGTLGLSGIILSLGMIPSLSTVADNRWGLLLLAKIGVYLLLAGVATVATFVVSPRLRRLAEGSESGGEHREFKTAGRVTIGYQGRVYDLSSSRLWKGGKHARRHEAWQDLTAAMGGAPHGPEVFETFPELSGSTSGTPRPVRAFMLLAYGNLFLVLAVLLIVAVW
ncbi:MAG: CopD family protein [Thermoleophilia bacterium]